MLTGSLGMLPSASLGGDGPGSSSPSTARRPTSPGQGIANPLATFLSVAMMLRHGLDRAGRRRPDRGGGRVGAGARPAHGGPRGGRRGAGRHRGDDRRRGRGPVDAAGRRPPYLRAMEKTEWIWMNGELVRLGRREGPRAQPRPALRHRRLRGHPLLRDRSRARDLPPPRAPRPAREVGRALLPAAAVHARPRSARRRTS